MVEYYNLVIVAVSFLMQSLIRVEVRSDGEGKGMKEEERERGREYISHVTENLWLPSSIAGSWC